MSNYNRFEAKLNAVKKEKKPYKIPVMSAKRKEVMKEYKKIVKDMIKDDTVCKIGAPGCTSKPSGLHHLAKRSPKNLCDINNLVPCCSKCNLWIEENSMEAIAKSFTISRFKK